MLYVLIQTGQRHEAIPARDIIEIVPTVQFQSVRRSKTNSTSVYCAGIFKYHGINVPVVDLCRLVSKRGASHHYSTRILLVRNPVNPENVVGILAENVVNTIQGENTPHLASKDETVSTHDEDMDNQPHGSVTFTSLKSLLPDSIWDELQCIFMESHHDS